MISRGQVSYKCAHDECIHQVYGFTSTEERHEHTKKHVKIWTRDLKPPVPEQPLPRVASLDYMNQSSPASLPRLSVPSILPSLSALGQSQPRDRRGSIPGYPTAAPELPSQRRGSIQMETDVDPMLPPMKRSRVGHSRLESIGELRLTREAELCLRCRVQGKPVS